MSARSDVEFRPPMPGGGRTALTWTAALLGVALLAGFLYWWHAIRDSSPARPVIVGALSAEEAVTGFLTDLQSGDTELALEHISPMELDYVASMIPLIVRQTRADPFLPDGDPTTDGQPGPGRADSDARDLTAELLGAINFDVASHSTDAFPITDSIYAVKVTVTDGAVSIDGDAIADVVTNYLADKIPSVVIDAIGPQIARLASTGLLDTFVLIAVEEEAGWFVSPVSSVAATPGASAFESLDAWESWTAEHGGLTLPDRLTYDDAALAGEAFLDHLADPTPYLTPVESRALALYRYFEGPDLPIDNFDLSGSHLEAVELTGGTALALLNSVTATVEFRGEVYSGVVDNYNVTINDCWPISIAALASPELPLLGIVALDDDGWQVSLGGSAVNMVTVSALHQDSIRNFLQSRAGILALTCF